MLRSAKLEPEKIHFEVYLKIYVVSIADLCILYKKNPRSIADLCILDKKNSEICFGDKKMPIPIIMGGRYQFPRFVAILLIGASTSMTQAHILPFSFGMTGNQVVPPTTSSARGSGLFLYNHHTFNYDFDLFISGIALGDLLDVGPNGTPIQIFNAPYGKVGDVVLDPGFFGSFVQDGDVIRLTLTNIRIGGQQGNFSSGIFTNETALFDGNLYVQVFTTQYPDGEIRGQLPPYGRFLGNTGVRSEVNTRGVSQIPAPSALAGLALAGLFASRRRR